MEIYGLYGKSGTGKSHKVFKVLYDLKINAVIDDGLLIVNKKKVAGKTAKNENSLIAATKRATFYSDSHRDEVYTYIRKANINSLLIVGTSKKMISKIVERLDLPTDISWIAIESYQTSKELITAQQKRTKNFHVIPVCPDEISNTFNGSWFKKLIIKLGKSKESILLVKPIYQQKNKIIISPECIKDIVNIVSISSFYIHNLQIDYEKVTITISTKGECKIGNLIEWRDELVSILYKISKINYTVDIKWRAITVEKKSSFFSTTL
ncbi:hypothetical protein PY093_18065 [Cytobacillus sp. S13-E01]|uniref:hypothetical protein n=1 Tax=Cytobacillus sp. S13-E01 TaxID=3031326 RepID=UPI0023D84C17|nr:hypothetical protein [Cytobacillus sp. S13-E01]MDF0728543.1 hypothetical protein [Cytobacillus sp. S13-E01]